ncbi:hypothetical protein ACFOGJ_16755 [Marinibaculum pumilum]|uniref:Uncharacterized protein n=1 Tax=Marinibaculum pumilum TaxID=1766165 RepID=A0ABV7L3L9_9PROT
MILSVNQLEVAKSALGADPVPTDHPAMPQLQQAFGEHTFYLDARGLLVFEPVQEETSANDPARLYLVAAWADESRQQLSPVQPQPTDVVVDLAPPADA